MNIHFAPLTNPTPEIAAAFTRWENDPVLIPFSRPNRNEEDLAKRTVVTPDDLAQRLQHDSIYLICFDAQLIGEINFQIDPPHLFKKVAGTAWMSITIGEAYGRGRGIGVHAMRYLEQQIQAHGCPRIELGVFAFNAPALALYRKLQYREIGRIPDFTYWDGRMWEDIRMEKMLQS